MIPAAHVVHRGEGRPVLFLHGQGVDGRSLLCLDDVFSDGPWERWYLDLPGFGKTPPLDNAGGLPELADYVDEFVGESFLDEHFAVVADSMGCALARDLLARRKHQVLGMALIAPVVDPVHANRRVATHEVLVSDPELLATIPPEEVDDYVAMGAVQSPETWELYRTGIVPGLHCYDQSAFDRLDNRYWLADVPEGRIGEYDGEMLMVMGRQDQVVGFEDQMALLAHYPHCTAVVLSPGGHNVYLDQLATVKALMRSWLDRL